MYTICVKRFDAKTEMVMRETMEKVTEYLKTIEHDMTEAAKENMAYEVTIQSDEWQRSYKKINTMVSIAPKIDLKKASYVMVSQKTLDDIHAIPVANIKYAGSLHVSKETLTPEEIIALAATPLKTNEKYQLFDLEYTELCGERRKYKLLLEK